MADGDFVGNTWVMTGTNKGNIGGYLPTNKRLLANGMTIYHFNDGKVCGHTQVYDRTTIMKQLGINKNRCLPDVVVLPQGGCYSRCFAACLRTCFTVSFILSR